MNEETEALTSPPADDTAVQDLTNQETADGGGESPTQGNDPYRKRYEDSSREAKRLYEEKVQLQARLEAIERERSLKAQSEQQAREQQATQFVPEELFVKQWIDKGLPEDAARLLYQDRRYLHEQMMGSSFQIQALQNKIKFQELNSSRIAIQNNPEAKAAAEFCKQYPELASLPLADQVDRYHSFQEKMGIKSNQRDLSSIKSAAGGAPGGMGGGAMNPSVNAANEESAKKLGFPSAKAMAEFDKVTTDSDMAQFMKKYPTYKPY